MPTIAVTEGKSKKKSEVSGDGSHDTFPNGCRAVRFAPPGSCINSDVPYQYLPMSLATVKPVQVASAMFLGSTQSAMG